MFEPYRQADTSTTRRYGETGLGLTITQRFCIFMGGTITVHSELRKGSVFRVGLPAVVRESWSIARAEVGGRNEAGRTRSD